MKKHRQEKSGDRGYHPDYAIIGFPGKSEADAEHAGEKRMNKRSHHLPNKKRFGQQIAAHLNGPAEIEDVFNHRKAETDHRCVNNSIDYVVKLRALPKEQKQDE